MGEGHRHRRILAALAACIAVLAIAAAPAAATFVVEISPAGEFSMSGRVEFRTASHVIACQVTLTGTLVERATGEAGVGFHPEVNPQIGAWQGFRAGECTPEGSSVEAVNELPRTIYALGYESNGGIVFAVFDEEARFHLVQPEAEVDCEMRGRLSVFLPVGTAEVAEVAELNARSRGTQRGRCDGEALRLAGRLTLGSPLTVFAEFI